MIKKHKILILSSYIGLILIFLIFKHNHIPCIFKKIFNIPCPACGMTRAFNAISMFNFKQAFSYNILSIPLFIVLIGIFTITIIDIIYNKKHLNKLLNITIKYYYIIIILLIFSWIINIYRNI